MELYIWKKKRELFYLIYLKYLTYAFISDMYELILIFKCRIETWIKWSCNILRNHGTNRRSQPTKYIID